MWDTNDMKDLDKNQKVNLKSEGFNLDKTKELKEDEDSKYLIISNYHNNHNCIYLEKTLDSNWNDLFKDLINEFNEKVSNGDDNTFLIKDTLFSGGSSIGLEITKGNNISWKQVFKSLSENKMKDLKGDLSVGDSARPNEIEDNKYYTPSLEEFYIGFEYEIFDSHPNMKFIKNTYDKKKDINNINDLLESGYIRVKYLDKEDIESLGFNYNTNSSIGFYTIEINKGLINIFGQHELFYGKHKYTIILNEKDTRNSFTLFSGIIKNKSELKVLLKQLQIIK